nr:hypothetical protein PHYPA_025237 [Physcomitrium patens]
MRNSARSASDQVAFGIRGVTQHNLMYEEPPPLIGLCG